LHPLGLATVVEPLERNLRLSGGAPGPVAPSGSRCAPALSANLRSALTACNTTAPHATGDERDDEAGCLAVPVGSQRGRGRAKIDAAVDPVSLVVDTGGVEQRVVRLTLVIVAE